MQHFDSLRIPLVAITRSKRRLRPLLRARRRLRHAILPLPYVWSSYVVNDHFGTVISESKYPGHYLSLKHSELGRSTDL